MQLNLDGLLEEKESNSLKQRYDKLDEHIKITLQQLGGMRSLFDGFLDTMKLFETEEYADVFLLVQGKYIAPNQSALAIKNIHKLVLLNKKPDILKTINVSWPTTIKNPIPKELIEKRERILYAYLEAPKSVSHSTIIHYLDAQYPEFEEDLDKFYKTLKTGHIKSYADKRPILTHVNKNIYVNSKGKKDTNASKKFDDTLIDIQEAKAVLLILLGEINRFISKLIKYYNDTLQITYVKHGSLRPKTKSLKIKNDIVITEIAPTLWNQCKEFQHAALHIKDETNKLLLEINSLDITNHKYLKRKTFKERIKERKNTKNRKLNMKKAKTPAKKKTTNKVNKPKQNHTNNNENKEKEPKQNLFTFWNNNNKNNNNKNNKNNKNTNRKRTRQDMMGLNS